MALPAKLKHFTLFNEGHSYLGEVSEIVLPKLSVKMEEYRSGGMDIPVDIDFGMEKMEMEWTIGGYVKQVLQQFGALNHAAIGLRFVGSLQREDSEDVKAVEVVVRGRHKEIDFGTAKAGEDTEKKITTSLSYYKLTIDGEELVEIDAVNLVRRFGDRDLLQQVRAILGV